MTALVDLPWVCRNRDTILEAIVVGAVEEFG